jgi:hypothetical protein
LVAALSVDTLTASNKVRTSIGVSIVRRASA